MNVPRLTADIINKVIASASAVATTPIDITEQAPDMSWRKTMWGTADGVTKPLYALTDDHLRNIIFYLNRETGYVLKRDEYTAAETIGYNGVWDKRKPVYDLLLMEADYRHLSWR